MNDNVSVERTIAASPEAVWSLVAEVTRMGEWSPETVACKWVGSQSSPVVGARFRGSNRLGVRRWSTSCTVTDAIPGQTFAFEVKAGPFAISRWEYRFEATAGGCRVIETWTDRRGAPMKPLGKLISGVGDRASHNRATMESTLEQLAAAAAGART
ncbi:MAG: SRPBCC family protein [Actinomycetota bacterium]